jgi:hypothetical protein
MGHRKSITSFHMLHFISVNGFFSEVNFLFMILSMAVRWVVTPRALGRRTVTAQIAVDILTALRNSVLVRL